MFGFSLSAPAPAPAKGRLTSELNEDYDKSGFCRVEYAKTGRATCKQCDRAIAEDSCRVAELRQSRFHDGYETVWQHLACALKRYGMRKITQLRGWQGLKYSDILKIREATQDPAPDNADEKKIAADHELVWELKRAIMQKLKPKEIKELMAHNKLPAEKVDLHDMAHVIADAFLYGMLAPCPVCKGNTLASKVGQLLCEGWLSGFSSCAYRGKPADAERYRFEIPESLQDKLAWVAPWIQKKGVQLTFEAPSGDAKDEADAGDGGDDDGEEDLDSLKVNDLKSRLEKHGVINPKGKKADLVALLRQHMAPSATVQSDSKEQDKQVEEDLDSLKVNELKERLEALKLPTKGKKADLVSRLRDALAQTAASSTSAVVPMDTSDAPAPNDEAEQLDVSSMTVAELKVELTKRELDTKGKKADLASRLQSALTSKKTLGKRGRDEPTEAATSSSTTAVAPAPAAKKAKSGALPARPATLLQARPAGAGPAGVDEATVEERKKAQTKPLPGSEILKVDPNYPRRGLPSVLVGDDGLEVFNCMFNKVDLESGHNPFYRLVIIDTTLPRSRYDVFTKWGRTGDTYFTKSGGGYSASAYQVKSFGKKEDAIAYFHEKFKKLTSNKWDDRFAFVKKPNQYNYVELSRGEEEEKKGTSLAATTTVESKLSQPVQEFVNLIFDAKAMAKQMADFNVDTNKMPLGKLSKLTLNQGLSVLKELETLLQQTQEQKGDGRVWTSRIVEASNRFFSLIPSNHPDRIDSMDKLKAKMDMMECLSQLEVANELMKEQKEKKEDLHPIDKNYQSLAIDLEALDKKSEEYKMVETYVKNTHGATHAGYSLKILDVFRANKHGDSDKFKPFSDMHNRQLLWHGSRLTNWIGILSQGLRIAPPEAPATGYMFGKGVYFANMVSKSANYCFTTRDNNIGVMLLSEVALGDMYEIGHSEYMDKPPAKKHSTKGFGRTFPNPDQDLELEDGLVVPYGKPVNKSDRVTDLQYDEFIVYNTAQIHMKYVLKLEFVHKTSYF